MQNEIRGRSNRRTLATSQQKKIEKKREKDRERERGTGDVRHMNDVSNVSDASK